MKDLLIATKNKNKYKEVTEILNSLEFNFKSLLDFPHIQPVKETGESFKENAQEKALIYSMRANMFTIADDSGLVVKRLNNKPGVYSSRFAGPKATDEENNQKLLNMLKDVPVGQRQASFVCYIAIADSGKLIDGCEGRCKGQIAVVPKGNSGFGYDPLFIPEGYDKTFAELGAETKNRLSHRYKALLQARKILEELD